MMVMGVCGQVEELVLHLDNKGFLTDPALGIRFAEPVGRNCITFSLKAKGRFVPLLSTGLPQHFPQGQYACFSAASG